MAIEELDREHHSHRLEKARKPGSGFGLLKGMAVLWKHLFKRATSNVIQYPDEKQDLSPRTRGVIALKEENCTVCMLCGRECPDWCIYIDSHKEQLPPKREGGRSRKRNVLDRFAIDYALCMYCGICVEVCPYDALFWSREFEYAEYDIRELTHEKERLSDWMSSVLPPPALEEGALLPGQPEPEPDHPKVTESKPAGAATPATPTASAAEARPRQAADAPRAPTAAPTPPKEETVEERDLEAIPEAQRTGQPPAKAETDAPSEPVAPKAPDRPTEEAKEAPHAEVVPGEAPPAQPTPRTEPPPPAPTVPPVSGEEAQTIYEQVLKDQLERGASPQVAEARAKVARVKAERGIARPPTEIDTPKRVPSAPTKGEATEPTPPGAPRADEPKPEQGPVAPDEGEDKDEG